MRIVSLAVAGLLLVSTRVLSAADQGELPKAKEAAPKDQKKPAAKSRIDREAEKIFNRSGGKESGELTQDQFNDARPSADKAIKLLIQERVIGGVKPLEKKDDPGDLSKNAKVTLEEFKLFFHGLAVDADDNVRQSRSAGRLHRRRGAPLASGPAPTRDYELESDLARARQWERWQRDREWELLRRQRWFDGFNPGLFGIPIAIDVTGPAAGNNPIGNNPSPIGPTPPPPRTKLPPPAPKLPQPKGPNKLQDDGGKRIS